MQDSDVLDSAAKAISFFAAVNMNVWALLIVCLAWVLVEHMRCTRDVKVASIEHGKAKSVPPDKQGRRGRHKKNRRG
jgi:hypothetical protein